MMAVDIETPTIQEVTSDIIDYRGKTPPKTQSGVKLITAKVIKDGAIVDGNHEYISHETYQWWMRRGMPQQWDILLTTEAPLGEVAQLRTSEQIALAQRVILLRGNPCLIDQSYFFQALKSPFFQAELSKRATGTTVLGIKQSELRMARVPLPPLPTQRKIAAILAVYDDLIENNTRRIVLLEAMAQALYREWFVRFRFPGHQSVPMVDSPLGPIPLGWQVVKLGGMCEIIMGQSPSSEFYNESGDGLPFHQGVRDFGEHFPTDRVYCTATSVRMAESGDVLFSVRAPVGRINTATHQIILGRGLSAIRSRTGNQTFVYFQLKDRFQEEDSMGNGAIFKAVSKDDMRGIETIQPPSNLTEIFEQQATPTFEQIKTLTFRNANLRCTRDLLLPKLVSGAVDVSGMEIAAGE